MSSSSAPLQRPHGLGRKAVVRYYNELASLPAPHEEFCYLDLPGGLDGPLMNALPTMREYGLVEPAGRQQHPAGESGEVPHYRVVPVWHDRHREHEPDLVLPCGHRGFRNLGGGRFECRAEWCGERFTRETVERAAPGE